MKRFCDWDQTPITEMDHFVPALKLKKEEFPEFELEEDKLFCSEKCKENFIDMLSEV